MKNVLVGFLVAFVAQGSLLQACYENLDKFLPEDSRIKQISAKNPYSWFFPSEVACSCDALNKALDDKLLGKDYLRQNDLYEKDYERRIFIEVSKIKKLREKIDDPIIVYNEKIEIDRILANESSEVRIEEYKKFKSAKQNVVNEIIKKHSEGAAEREEKSKKVKLAREKRDKELENLRIVMLDACNKRLS